jgi:hypothetical protein
MQQILGPVITDPAPSPTQKNCCETTFTSPKIYRDGLNSWPIPSENDPVSRCKYLDTEDILETFVSKCVKLNAARASYR